MFVDADLEFAGSADDPLELCANLLAVVVFILNGRYVRPGLGLAIAQDVVRSHGGESSLTRAPQGGLRAVLRVPV